MRNEYTATLGNKTLKLYSITFRTDTKTAETVTLDTGVIRRLAGSRKNIYTLKGRMVYVNFKDFCDYVNSNIGMQLVLGIGLLQKTLTLTKGECTACEENMCEYQLELEEVTG